MERELKWQRANQLKGSRCRMPLQEVWHRNLAAPGVSRGQTDTSSLQAWPMGTASPTTLVFSGWEADANKIP